MKHFFKKSDLIYPKNYRVKPYCIYILLLMLNKVSTSLLGLFRIIFKILRLKCKFKILNKELHFYIYSNIESFKYHRGMACETRISENFLRLMPRDSLFYDIGCALGWYSILVADRCKKIIGFDPYDKSSLLNISLNNINNFKLYPYFLSDCQKTDSTDSVEITNIDNLIKRGFLKPNVIKIDVEGGEYKILLGAKNLFDTIPPKLILIETHSEELFYNCLEFLKSFNYQIYNLGCPKINTGGDLYSNSYSLETDVFSTLSETRTLLGLKR